MNKIKLRQICFLFIGMMPITKLLMYPSILPYYAKNDVVLSAAINFILQGIVWNPQRVRPLTRIM